MIESGFSGTWYSLVEESLSLGYSVCCFVLRFNVLASSVFALPVFALSVLVVFRLMVEFFRWFRDLSAVVGVNPRCFLCGFYGCMCRQEYLEWTSPASGVSVLFPQVPYHLPVTRLEVM